MTDEKPAGHTPEGYTKEKPAADELGQTGSPGAGMTPDVPHAADADLVDAGHAPTDPIASEHVAHHDAVTHMDEHTTISDDDHGHAEDTLGPIDWGKWGYAIIGGAAGLVTLFFFLVAYGGTL